MTQHLIPLATWEDVSADLRTAIGDSEHGAAMLEQCRRVWQFDHARSVVNARFNAIYDAVRPVGNRAARRRAAAIARRPS